MLPHQCTRSGPRCSLAPHMECVSKTHMQLKQLTHKLSSCRALHGSCSAATSGNTVLQQATPCQAPKQDHIRLGLPGCAHRQGLLLEGAGLARSCMAWLATMSLRRPRKSALAPELKRSSRSISFSILCCQRQPRPPSSSSLSSLYIGMRACKAARRLCPKCMHVVYGAPRMPTAAEL